MPSSLESRLAKLELNNPALGDRFYLTVVYRPGDLSAAMSRAYAQLVARGYDPERHDLYTTSLPDNGRPYPGDSSPERITITRG